MVLDLYKNLSDEGKLIVIESGKPLREQILNVDWNQLIILANGKKVSPDYEPTPEDYLVIRRIPGSTAVVAWIAIAVAVIGGIAAGVSVYKAKQQQKKLKEMQEALSARDDVSNVPWLQGANNALATGKTQPYIVGKHLFTPYLLQQSFYKISGTDGINQDVYITLEGGFGKQAIQKISADEAPLYDFGNQTTPQTGTYRPQSGVFKYFSGVNDNKIQISQNTALGSSGLDTDFIYKRAVETPNVQLPWREDVEQWTATKTEEYTEKVWVETGDDRGYYRNVKRTRTVEYQAGSVKTETKKFTLDMYARDVEICIMFNGLCKYSDKGKKQNHTRRIGFRYSTNGGSSWSPLNVGGGSVVTENNIQYYVVSYTRSVTEQIRFALSHEFTWSDASAAKANGTPIIVEVTNRDTKNNDTGGCYEDCYVQWVQSRIYDAEKSSSSFVLCKVLEDKEAALSTVIGVKLRASEENQDKLGKINMITSGVARTWSGASWGSTKSATSNPASWLIEVLSSDVHPASRFDPSAELDMASFGALYTFCETNGFKVNMVLTAGQKKAQILETICGVCRSMLYRNIYGKIAVAIDQVKENAITLLNAQNILGIEVTKNFARRTDGLKLSWVSAKEGYVQDESICMRPGVTRTSDSIIREMDVQGITDYDHLMKYARYIMAGEALRPKTIKVRTGKEGVYYTPFSKILMQDDALRVGLGNATVRQLITSGGNIIGLKLNEYIDLDTTNSFGVIIQCVSDDYCTLLAKPINGGGRTDEISFIEPFSVESSVIPHAGDVLSYGYLDNGEFDRITSPYLITGIEPGENDVTLQLIDYDPDVYTTGAYGEYVPNITRKVAPYEPVIIPPPETSDKVEEVLSGDNIAPPDTPLSVSAVATERGLVLAVAPPDNSYLNNSIAKIIWEYSPDGIKPEGSTTDEPTFIAWEPVTTFEATMPWNGYPEASDLDSWLVRVKFVSVYGKESDYSAYVTVNTDSYGTWLVQNPVITLRTNKRSLHLNLQQPTHIKVYGNVRYQIQISRFDDIEEETRLWYKPNLSADPYGAETNYKVDTDPPPAPDYVVATNDFSITVPLVGQAAQEPDPSDTVYYFRITPFNEAGTGSAVVTDQMTARATGARDVVLAHLGDGSQHPDALTAKNIYTENLTAIVGTFSQMQGDVETSDNFWKGMDTDNPEFRVGNDHNLEEQDDEDAEFIHYKDGSLAMKLKNFIVTVAETTIKGTLTLYNAAKTFRNLVSSAGMRFQKKVTDWLNPVDVAQISADSDSNLTITNNPAALADYQIAPPSNSIKIHHLDTSLNDTDGNNTESLVAASGACGATAEPILERLTSYFAGKLKKAGVVTKSAPAYNQQAWTQSGFVILGVCNGIVAGYTVSGDVYTCKTYNAATGDLLTSFDITFGSNVTNRKVKAFWVKTPAFGWEFVFGSSYYAVIPQVYSKYFWYFYHQDGTGIWGAPDAGADLGCAYNYSKDSFVAFATGISGKTLTVQTVDLSSWGRATYSYTINNQYVTELIAGQVAGGMIMLKFNNTNLPSHPWLYIVPWSCTGDINTNIYEELYFVDSWTDYGSDNGYFHLLNESGTRYLFPNTSLMNPVTINSDYFPIRNGADNDTVYLYKPGDNSIYALANGTYSKIGTTVGSSSYLARFDNNKKYYAVDNSLYYYPSYCQILVAEKHYAFWFKGNAIKFGKLSIPTDPARWLYCRLTASGSTVSYYIVRDTLVNGALDVFANSSKSLATYSWEEDNNDLDFTLEGSVEEFTSDAADISSAVMLSMVQYKLPYGAPGSSGNLPGSDKFILLAKDPNKVTSNVIGAAQVLNANDAVTLSAGANPGARLVFITTGACTITYTGILGAQVTDSLGANVQVEYTWNGNAWLCTSAPPIGRIIEQKPDEPTPAAMYGGQWQEHNYGGVFFRSKGGDSCGFHAAYKVASWASGSSVTLAEDAKDGNGTAISANNYILVAVYGAASYYRKITAVSGRVLTLESALPSGYANLTDVMIGQAPRNLSHTHDKGSYRIKGWLGWFRKNTTGNNSRQKNGALEIYQDSYYTVADNTIASSTGGSWAIYLDTDLNDGSGFTGKSGATGHATETRPSSVAVVYWRRFQ